MRYNRRKPDEPARYHQNKLVFLYHEIHDEKLVHTVFEVLNSRDLPVRGWIEPWRF